MSNLQAVLSQLRCVRRNGSGYMALCPCHEDKKPSLSVKNGRDGRILLKCFAGCAYEDIAERLGLNADAGSVDNYGGDPVIKTYDYCAENGQLSFQVCRTASKEFPARTRGSGGWKWGMNGQKPILYRLPEILKAEGPIVIVEGEKDEGSLRSIGVTATCNPGGAGKWPSCCRKNPDFERPLYRKDVIICGDNDVPGREHVRDEIESLRSKVKSLKIITLPDGYKDVSDWIEAHDAVEPDQLRETLLEMATEQGASNE
ncbi:MAG TPA: CHC2 zinc finger domain-containing protein [Sedimentisphaerales bacterium]|nr:CHC2 zinc finger domain-containing protein [Sedimentisphaerales bacterium]